MLYHIINIIFLKIIFYISYLNYQSTLCYLDLLNVVIITILSFNKPNIGQLLFQSQNAYLQEYQQSYIINCKIVVYQKIIIIYIRVLRLRTTRGIIKFMISSQICIRLKYSYK
ncbi:transmembrane protein, putative (macronuclear) [Tetrahymena thermophila SB210]|uniref:Transmembrane protein, putative n=1 Tax=Tetrahymena thermophila (strain SB210) TaxID=312017 RepID=W7XE99_TETTS|nr:transmembrane protein, putative [Tetrahymena thermophila SB210]EWS71199.1 transmembrane protein, putative [Tetrahymena thermophila SB210]|eukprot:XP_012656252.1 transmembrane protein, putative [Tetrahymena thermophila SB210]